MVRFLSIFSTLFLSIMPMTYLRPLLNYPITIAGLSFNLFEICTLLTTGWSSFLIHLIYVNLQTKGGYIVDFETRFIGLLTLQILLYILVTSFYVNKFVFPFIVLQLSENHFIHVHINYQNRNFRVFERFIIRGAERLISRVCKEEINAFLLRLHLFYVVV